MSWCPTPHRDVDCVHRTQLANSASMTITPTSDRCGAYHTPLREPNDYTTRRGNHSPRTIADWRHLLIMYRRRTVLRIRRCTVFDVRRLALPFVMLLLDPSIVRADDFDIGSHVFRRCAVCHSIRDGVNMVGPTLFGIVGRPSGSIHDFNYSSSMLSAGITWTSISLDRYLANPQATVPGNKMSFPGVPDESERRALIRYLSSLK